MCLIWVLPHIIRTPPPAVHNNAASSSSGSIKVKQEYRLQSFPGCIPIEIEDALAKLPNEHRCVITRLCCSKCIQPGRPEEFAVPVFRETELQRFATTSKWMETEFIAAFLQLNAHCHHRPDVRVHHCMFPKAEVRNIHPLSDEVNTLLVMAHSQSHYSLIRIDVKTKSIEVTDGLSYPLSQWHVHIMATLIFYGLLPPGSQARKCLSKKRDSVEVYGLVPDLNRWTVTNDQSVKQVDGHSCGVIVCGKAWELLDPSDDFSLQAQSHEALRPLVIKRYKDLVRDFDLKVRPRRHAYVLDGDRMVEESALVSKEDGNAASFSLDRTTKSPFRRSPRRKTVGDDDDKTGRQCLICLQSFAANLLVRLPCGHEDHAPCLLTWVLGSSRCHVCRESFDESFIEELTKLTCEMKFDNGEDKSEAETEKKARERTTTTVVYASTQEHTPQQDTQQQYTPPAPPPSLEEARLEASASRDRFQSLANAKRRFGQDKQGQAMVKRFNKSILIYPGDRVVLAVDKTQRSRTASHGVLGIVYKVHNATKRINVVTEAGIIMAVSGKERQPHWLSPDKWNKIEMDYSLMPMELQKHTTSIRMDKFDESKVKLVSLKQAHIKMLDHSVVGMKRCKCKKMCLSSSCACRINGSICGSGCGCRGNCEHSDRMTSMAAALRGVALAHPHGGQVANRNAEMEADSSSDEIDSPTSSEDEDKKMPAIASPSDSERKMPASTPQSTSSLDWSSPDRPPSPPLFSSPGLLASPGDHTAYFSGVGRMTLTGDASEEDSTVVLKNRLS
jgi:hypothetical protein